LKGLKGFEGWVRLENWVSDCI